MYPKTRWFGVSTRIEKILVLVSSKYVASYWAIGTCKQSTYYQRWLADSGTWNIGKKRDEVVPCGPFELLEWVD